MLPNLISIGRIALILPIALLYGNSATWAYWTVIALLLISYLSDYLDGMLARKLNQMSKLGLILDPLADKLWTMALMYLLIRYRNLEVWIALIIVGRDIAILSLNFWMYRRKRIVLPSDEFGRKYMVLVGIVIIGLTLNLPGVQWLVYLVLVFAPFTLYRYTRRIIKRVNVEDDSKIEQQQVVVKD